jgi:hypothetical protein
MDIKTVHYSGPVTLDPKSYRLTAKLNIKFFLSKKTNSVKFLINKKCNISSVLVEDLSSYEVIKQNDFPFCEEGNFLILKFVKPKKILNVSIMYSLTTSKIGTWGVNKITNSYTELGLYTPWYPFIPNVDVTYKIKVLGKNSYKIASIGTIEHAKGNYLIDSKAKQKSILLFSSKEIFNPIIKEDNINIKISYFKKEHKEFASLIAKQTKQILKYYNTILPPLENNKIFNIFIANRDKGGSYARVNSIIMQYVDNYLSKENRLLKSLAHEIAHLWWCKASVDSWEDWLNESFAEYFALLSLKELIGKNHFKNLIEDKEATINNLPPIRNLSRKDPKAFDVLYNKGAFILNEFANTVGKEAFLLMCNDIINKNITTTETLLNYVSNKFGLKMKAFLDRLISN